MIDCNSKNICYDTGVSSRTVSGTIQYGLDQALKKQISKEMQKIQKSFKIPCSLLGKTEKEKPMKKKTKPTNNYDFKVQNPGMIDDVEIEKELSRENPLAFVVQNKKNSVKIHGSIILKAGILNIKRNIAYDFNMSDSKTKTAWIKWVKKVKTAPWKEHKKETSVKVIFPNI